MDPVALSAKPGCGACCQCPVGEPTDELMNKREKKKKKRKKKKKKGKKKKRKKEKKKKKEKRPMNKKMKNAWPMRVGTLEPWLKEVHQGPIQAVTS